MDDVIPTVLTLVLSWRSSSTLNLAFEAIKFWPDRRHLAPLNSLRAHGWLFPCLAPFLVFLTTSNWNWGRALLATVGSFRCLEKDRLRKWSYLGCSSLRILLTLLQNLWAIPCSSQLPLPLTSVQAGVLWFATENLKTQPRIYLFRLICNYSPFWILLGDTHSPHLPVKRPFVVGSAQSCLLLPLSQMPFSRLLAF